MAQNINTGITQANIAISGALEQKSALPKVLITPAGTNNLVLVCPANKAYLIISINFRIFNASSYLAITYASGTDYSINNAVGFYNFNTNILLNTGDQIEFVRNATSDGCNITYYEYDV